LSFIIARQPAVRPQLIDAGTGLLALVRSYGVSFGLVVLLSFGFALVLLVITPFTQTPIPGNMA